jgi:hypothetical protein
MQVHKNDLRTLADQVSKGDGCARQQLQQRLEPEMDRILRRVLRKNAAVPAQASSALERQLLSAAERAARTTHPPAAGRGELASRLCETMLDRLEAGPRGAQRLLATVCG